jgi:hypothetical protein
MDVTEKIELLTPDKKLLIDLRTFLDDWTGGPGIQDGDVWADFRDRFRPGRGQAVAMTDVMILRSLPARYLDDEGDGYGGVPFISLDEAIRALTTDRDAAVKHALEV